MSAFVDQAGRPVVPAENGGRRWYHEGAARPDRPVTATLRALEGEADTERKHRRGDCGRYELAVEGP